MTTASQASPLLALGDPTQALDQARLDAPGAFAWWYVDALNEAGDGFALIWSFGLPFLPGQRGAAELGAPARARPSLNLALYRGGRQVDYALQEYEANDAEWSPDEAHFRFGRSQISVTRAHGRRRLEAALDAPIPGSAQRLVGRIQVEGAATQGFGPAGQGPHSWAPLAGPSQAELELQTEAGPFRHRGLAYQDRNGSEHPLHQLGIAEWAWGRSVQADRVCAYYVVWPREPGPPVAWWAEIDAQGRAELQTELPLIVEAPRRGRYGMQHRALQIGAHRVEPHRLLEDGPFYLRVQQQLDGVPAIGEWVRPDRVDLPHHRPFVRMRVHRIAGPNSFWLPLFNGPSQGRWSRLWGPT